MSELDQPTGKELAIQAVGAAFAGLIGLVVGGPIGALAGAAMTPYGIRWIQLSVREWTRSSQLVAEGAIEASGVEDADEFFRLMEQDPGLTALAQQILFAARMSSNEQKLRALGQLLGGAVAQRGDHLDEAVLLATVLSDIDQAQVVTLDILSGEPDDAEEQRKAAREAGNPDREPTWLVSQVRTKLPMNPDLAVVCLSELVRHGLAETVATYGGGWRYRITPVGRSLTAMLAKAAG